MSQLNREKLEELFETTTAEINILKPQVDKVADIIRAISSVVSLANDASSDPDLAFLSTLANDTSSKEVELYDLFVELSGKLDDLEYDQAFAQRQLRRLYDKEAYDYINNYSYPSYNESPVFRDID